MTNIVAQRKFRAKGVYFDDQHMKLHAKGRTLGLVKHMYGHDVLEYASHEVIQPSTSEGVEVEVEDQVMKQSIPEGVEMKGVKKTEQISSRKQAYSRAPERAEDRRDKAHHRAVSTHLHADDSHQKKSSEKSSNGIKFGIFSLISPHWLGHKKKINVNSGLISTNGIAMTLPSHQFDWSRSQVWRKRGASEVASSDQKHMEHMEHMKQMKQPH